MDLTQNTLKKEILPHFQAGDKMHRQVLEPEIRFISESTTYSQLSEVYLLNNVFHKLV